MTQLPPSDHAAPDEAIRLVFSVRDQLASPDLQVETLNIPDAPTRIVLREILHESRQRIDDLIASLDT